MIYLNNAATSFPKPPEVAKAVSDYLGSEPFNCLRSGYSGQEKDIIFSCREKLAGLFNASDPNNIIFTSGATEALNLAMFGLGLRGGHVITTAMEHNSVLRPLNKLKEDGLIELTVTKCDKAGKVDPNEVAGSVNERTKAVIINQASNVIGAVQDIRAISEGIKKKNKDIALVVDAAQSAGCIPIDVSEENIDILVFTGHKALYGVPGTGGLYLNERILLSPLKYGGTGSESEVILQPEAIPLKYEAGTPNIPGIVALEAGVDFIIKTGLDVIKERKARMTSMIMQGLSGYPEISVYGPTDVSDKVPVVSFNISGIPTEDAGRILEDTFGIVTRTGLHCAPLIHKELGTYPHGAVRVSPSYFTTENEIDRFLYALKEMVAMS